MVIGGVTCFEDAHQSETDKYAETNKKGIVCLRYFKDEDQHVETIALTISANQRRCCCSLNKSNEYQGRGSSDQATWRLRFLELLLIRDC